MIVMPLARAWMRQLTAASAAALALPVAVFVALALLGLTGGFGGLGSLGQVFAGPSGRAPVAASHNPAASSLPVMRSSGAAAPKPATNRAGHPSAVSAKA
jgi:hypothetical protein